MNHSSRSYSLIATLCVASAVAIVLGCLVRIPEPIMSATVLKPSLAHPLGLSPYGHDLLRLVAVASLRTVAQATTAASATVLVALIIGIMAACTKDGIFDRAQQVAARLLDSLGVFLFAASLVTISSRLSMWQLALLLSLVAWPNLSHIVRAETIAALRLPYLDAATAVGVGTCRLVLKYILPELVDRLLPAALALIASFVGVFGALQFLGVGVADEINLGFMVYDGAQNYLRSSPWYFAASVSAFFCMLAVIALIASVAYAHKRQRTNVTHVGAGPESQYAGNEAVVART